VKHRCIRSMLSIFFFNQEDQMNRISKVDSISSFIYVLVNGVLLFLGGKIILSFNAFM